MTNRKPSPAPTDAPPTEPIHVELCEVSRTTFEHGKTYHIIAQRGCVNCGASAAPAPQQAEVERAMEHIKEKIHFYLGSDSMSDCWGEVGPLIEKLCRTQQREAVEADALVDKVIERIKEGVRAQHDPEFNFPGQATGVHGTDLVDPELVIDAMNALKGRYALRRAQGELSALVKKWRAEIADAHAEGYDPAKILMQESLTDELEQAITAPQLISNKTPKEPSND